MIAGRFDAAFWVIAAQHFWLDESGRRDMTSDQQSFLRRDVSDSASF